MPIILCVRMSADSTKGRFCSLLLLVFFLHHFNFGSFMHAHYSLSSRMHRNPFARQIHISLLHISSFFFFFWLSFAICRFHFLIRLHGPTSHLLLVFVLHGYNSNFGQMMDSIIPNNNNIKDVGHIE